MTKQEQSAEIQGVSKESVTRDCEQAGQQALHTQHSQNSMSWFFVCWVPVAPQDIKHIKSEEQKSLPVGAPVGMAAMRTLIVLLKIS